ncbi:MAG: hypothetical protein OWU84_08315 [Firmicutes bacterium]|nr:hypothetical protein [Bacillota bacterium]
MSLTAETLRPDRAESWIAAVRRFADVALAAGRDRYGASPTPLLADGLDVVTLEPVIWRVNGEEWILSNWASQQIFMRTLTGLSRILHDDRYRQAAEDITAFALTALRPQRLFTWGGHMAFDLAKKRAVYAPDKGPVHELKCHYPDYDLMWQVNPEATRDYIEAVWEAHILDWDSLEFSRHGRLPPEAPPQERLWARPYARRPVPFVSQGLTFINAGSDLVYAAALLSDLSHDPAPLTWAKRLASRYVEVRHPKTHLGGYQFSISVLPGPKGRGDRAVEQFGEQLKAHEPTEVTLCVDRQIRTILGRAAINKMLLGMRLGPAGEEFQRWAVEDLLAYAHWSYLPEAHAFAPVLTDGTRLDGLRIERSGYYGRAGDVLMPLKSDYLLLWSYALGYRLTRDPILWEMVQSLLEALWPRTGDVAPDPVALFAFLDLYQATDDREFLVDAAQVADAIVARQTASGLFLSPRGRQYGKLDALEPLALLHLANAALGYPERLPHYWASRAFFGSQYGDLGHMTDDQLFYP